MPTTVIDPTLPVQGQIPDSITVRGRTLSGFHRLPSIEAAPLQRAILEAANNCGCQDGTVVAAGVLSAYLGLTLLLPMLQDQPVSATWWGALAVMLGGGVLGKALGVMRAGRKMRSGIETFDALVRGLHDPHSSPPKSL